jgi:hypothetical protein
MVAGRARWRLGLAAVLVVGLAAQGCRKDEENRPLLPHKGSYEGPTEPPLSDQQVEQLRLRAENQKF